VIALIKKMASVCFGKLMSWSARRYLVTLATEQKDFDDIAAFNYRIFSKEIQQHPENPGERLIDSYHKANSYIICRFKGEIIGMVCVTNPTIQGFSVAKKLADPSIMDAYLDNSLELRLLAIEKKHRGTRVFWKLMQTLVEYILKTNVQQVFISAISEREGMYRKFGFEPIAPAVKSGNAHFIPMKLTRARFLSMKTSLGFA
jgi:predicted GNAT family N-acyltransferase